MYYQGRIPSAVLWALGLLDVDLALATLIVFLLVTR